MKFKRHINDNLRCPICRDWAEYPYFGVNVCRKHCVELAGISYAEKLEK